MKSAFVTGAATGIGEGLVVRLQRGGWQVFGGFRERSPEGIRWVGLPNVTAVPCDVTDVAQLAAAADTIGHHTDGRLDLLINNAGYAGSAGVLEAPVIEEYRRSFEVNFWGPMQVVVAMMPLLRKSQGRIVNVSSASVYMTTPMGSAYPVSKVALNTMTKHLRMELAPFGIEVANLEPGGVATAMTELGPATGEQQWASIPEPLRDPYRQHFRDGASVIGDGFSFEEPDQFANQVSRKVISAKHLKVSYLVGPKVRALPWMHRLLPAQQVENIWRRRFAAKAS